MRRGYTSSACTAKALESPHREAKRKGERGSKHILAWAHAPHQSDPSLRPLLLRLRASIATKQGSRWHKLHIVWSKGTNVTADLKVGNSTGGNRRTYGHLGKFDRRNTLVILPTGTSHAQKTVSRARGDDLLLYLWYSAHERNELRTLSAPKFVALKHRTRAVVGTETRGG